MIAITISVFVYVFLYDNFSVPKSTIFIPLFAIFSFIGTMLYSKEYKSWISLVLLVISFYSFLLSFKILKNKYLVISIISLAFLLFGIYYIIHYRNEFLHIASILSDKYRLGSYFDNPNGVGAYSVVAFATSFYLVLFLKRKVRFFFLLPSLVSILVGVSTGSRTFFLMVIIIVAVFLYFFFQKHKFIYLIVLGATIAIGILVLNLPALSLLKDRLLLSFQTIFGTASKADTSTIQRANYIQYGFYLGSKNLLTGYGVDGFAVITEINTYSHCNFSEVLCNFGIMGFILFYAPLIVLLIKAITDKKIEKGFVVTFFVYYLIASFTTVLYYKKIYFLVLSFLFYLVYFDREKKSVLLCKELKKVVFTCDTLNNGGAERVISTLSNSFSDLKIGVSIIGVSDRFGNTPFYQLNNNVSYIKLCSGFKRRVCFIKRIILLKKQLKLIKPDIVISFLPHVNFYTMFACKALNIPYIVSERNDPKRDPKKLLIKLFKYLSFIKADGCVFQTVNARDYYYSSIQEKSIIIYNPICLEYTPDECIEKKTPVVLAVGRLTTQKNYKVLISAFKDFNQEMGGEYMLKIYGTGPLRDELIDFCKSIDVERYVSFMGSDDHWHVKEYKDAIYVLSSDYEGLPNSLIEAMALGIPSISTDCPCGGPKEIIKDGTNGLLVPVNDSSALAKKMIEITKISPELFYNSTRIMLDEFNVDTIATKWVNYIKSLKRDIYE